MARPAPRRVYRLSVLSCALEWFVAGVLLSDLVGRFGNGQRPWLGLTNLAFFIALGIGTVISLLRSARDSTQPAGSSTPAT